MKHRGIVMSTKGMVSSAHTLISAEGIKVLNQGGNAMDAAIAMALMSGIVLPDMTGLGADAFLLYYDHDSKKITAINGSSNAPIKASVDFFKTKGFNKMPGEGIYSITMPGAVDTYFKALELYGSKSFQELAQDTIEYARNGVPASEKVVRHMHTDYDKMLRSKDLSRYYLNNSQPLQVGDLIMNKDYADTLEYLCKEGRDGFYKGKIAKDIEERLDHYITAKQLQDVHCEVKEPISIQYRDYTIYQTPLVSQGIMHLEMMNILDEFDLKPGADSIHLMVEAKKIAFYDRSRYLGDPDFTYDYSRDLLSKSYAKKCARQISMNHTLNIEELLPVDHSHTTSFVVVDQQGNAVSMIHSISATWGSGVMVDGFLLNNRGSQFSFTGPNQIEPGKKTVHTLNTYMVTDQSGNLKYVGNTPGGDYQVQWNMQTLVNLIDFHLDVQSATEHAKWTEEENTIRIESQCGLEVIDALIKKGHQVKSIDPYTISGASQIIEIRDQIKLGGCDPRCDGAAMPQI